MQTHTLHPPPSSPYLQLRGLLAAKAAAQHVECSQQVGLSFRAPATARLILWGYGVQVRVQGSGERGPPPLPGSYCGGTGCK